MFEIVPNWHPLFVHFSVGLLITAAIIHVLVLVVSADHKRTLTTVANWNLWLGVAFTVLTVIAGWFAFNSVNHDTASHIVMLTHRKWAIATFITFILLVAWSLMRAKKQLIIAGPIVAAVVLASAMLLVTAWYGGELVYRHGLGVMSLPQKSDHSHADGSAHDHGGDAEDHGKSMESQGSGGHEHDTIDHDDGHAHGTTVDKRDEQAHTHDKSTADDHHHDEGAAPHKHVEKPPHNHDSID